MFDVVKIMERVLKLIKKKQDSINRPLRVCIDGRCGSGKTTIGKKIVERNITKMAQQNNIPIYEPDKISKEPDVIEKLKAIKPDFFITFAFGQILSQEVIDIPHIATINLHASLLPEYRGAVQLSEKERHPGCLDPP